MYGAAEMANSFRTVRRNTIQIAEDIPEDQYDFQAATGTRSVRSTLTHLIYSPKLQEDMQRVRRITTIKGYDFPAALAGIGAEEGVTRTKADIVELLKGEGERFATWLESVSDEFLAERYTDHMGQGGRTRFEALLSVKEHEMHHRGQLMLMQRIIGIVPHLTRARQAQFAQSQPAAST